MTKATYLVDVIYLSWSTFVKTVSNPQSRKHKHFTKAQDAARKDRVLQVPLIALISRLFNISLIFYLRTPQVRLANFQEQTLKFNMFKFVIRILIF